MVIQNKVQEEHIKWKWSNVLYFIHFLMAGFIVQGLMKEIGLYPKKNWKIT